MGTMASQITSLSIVYVAVYSGADQRKHQLRVTGLCVGKSPVTGEFPAKGPLCVEFNGDRWIPRTNMAMKTICLPKSS